MAFAIPLLIFVVSAFGASAVLPVETVAQNGGPLTFWTSQPVKPNQTVMLLGANYSVGAVVCAERLADGAPGSPLDVKQLRVPHQKIKPLQASGHLLQFVLPAGGTEGVYAYAIQSEGKTSPVGMINAPDIWFIQGDSGDTASPGGWIGVFGTCLSMPGKPLPKLALMTDGKVIRTLTARMAGGTRYGQYFDLPSDMPPGVYSVYAHNGHGGSSAWKRFNGYADEPITTFTVVPKSVWPATVFKVDRESGATDDEKLAAAIACAATNGGGIVALSSGTLKLTRSVVLPPKTVLRGLGLGQSVLQWSVEPIDEKGNPLPLVRGAKISVQAGGGRASFSLEDLSLIAAPTLGVCIVERANTTEPAHFQRVLFRCPRQKNEREAKPAILLAYARNLEISGCTLEGFTCISVDFTSAACLRITDNTLRWRGSALRLLSNHKNIIIEHNQFIMAGTFAENGYKREMNANPGLLWYDCFASSNVRDLYFAKNTSSREEAEPPDSSVGITFDGNNGAYWGRVASASGTRLTLTKPTAEADRYGHPPCRPGAFARIIAGRGIGQWRYLTSQKTTQVTEIEVDRPWDVEPDDTSWLAINNFNGRTLFVQNDFGNEPCLQTYFASTDVIWAENKIGVNGRRVAMPVWVGAIRGGMQSGWHYQVLDNQVFGTDMKTPIAHFGPTPADYTGPMTSGHIYRGNRAVEHGESFVIRPPAQTDGLLIENNQGLSDFHLDRANQTQGIIRANTDATGAPLKPARPEGLGILVNP